MSAIAYMLVGVYSLTEKWVLKDAAGHIDITWTLTSMIIINILFAISIWLNNKFIKKERTKKPHYQKC